MADLQALLEKLSGSKAGQTAGALLKGGSVDHLDWPDYAKTTVRQTRAYLPPPANPATPSAGWNQGVRDTLRGMFVEPVQQAGKALRGQLTEGEAQNFALEAAAGLIPMGRGLKAAKSGIRAYHGSPHDFDRFDISKIGTGEGAQAYGHGLYFAEAEPVARQYRDTLSLHNATPQPWELDNRRLAWSRLRGQLKKDGFAPEQIDNAIYDLEYAYGKGRKSSDLAQNEWTPGNREVMQQAVKRMGDKFDQLYKPPGGRMYEVNINANPDQFLDWDKPLSKQPEPIANLLTQDNPRLQDPYIKGKYSTGEAYSEFAGKVGGRDRASNALYEAGIPGIKYLDQSSRHASTSAPLLEADIAKAKAKGQPHIAEFLQQQLDTIPKPTSNYVVFDDKMIDILRKYGIAGAGLTGVLGSGFASRDALAAE